MTPLPSYRLAPIFWLGFSLSLYLAYVLVRKTIRPKYWQPLATVMEQHPGLMLFIRIVYYAGIPYLAMLQGDILPRLMGVSQINWVHDIGTGSALGCGAAVIIVILARYLGPRTPSRSASIRMAAPLPEWVVVTSNGLLFQIHWNFYRAACVQALGDLYWGALAGLIPMAVEVLSAPGLPRRLADGRHRSIEFAHMALAITTTAIYVYVSNLLMLAIIHGLTVAGVISSLPAAAREPSQIETSAGDGSDSGP